MLNWLIVWIGPLAIKVLAALGMGFVSFAALTSIASAVSDSVNNAYGSMSGPVLDIANMMGAGQAVGIILGAIVARATYSAIPRLGKLTQ